MLKNLPIKFKLMLVLVTLSVAILLTYATLALTDFRRDKLAYVFDSTLSHARSTANQLRSDLEFALDKVEFYTRGYDTQAKNFHPYAQSIFGAEKRFGILSSYHSDETKGQFVRSGLVKNALATDADLAAADSVAQSLVRDAMLAKVAIRTLPGQISKWLIAVRVQDASGAPPFVVIGLCVKAGFLEAIVNSQLQDTFLVGPSNDIVLKAENPVYTEVSGEDLGAAKDLIVGLLANSPESTKEYKSSNSNHNLLISGAQVGIGDLKVLAMIPTQAALEALLALGIKSAVFIMLLICVTIFVSLLGSNTLTAPINALFQATKKISQGDFNVNIEVRSHDEIGGLAESFNQMAKEIGRLLAETAEKARMQGELQTAQLVQSTLFPAKQFASGPIEIHGYYEPASECGGDWWYYNQIGHKTYLWIGDATGHGVSAALVTAAARSAANVVQEFPDLSPSRLMEIMNRAIYGTSKGQVLMTFFLGIFDSELNEFTYCNASHDPPYLFPGKQALKKSDIVPLMDGVGPRLGENAEQTYEKKTVKLNPGDRIVFYTDGVTELKDASGGMMGERKFLKGLLDSFNKSAEIKPAMDDLATTISDFRGTTPLKDDVTYFMFRVTK